MSGEDTHYIELSHEFGGVADLQRLSQSNQAKVKTSRDRPSSHEINLFSYENIAIPLTYISVGLLISFPSAYIQYYPRTLGASDSQLSTIGTIRALPWTFKIFYGFCADAFPIRGYRFKPYMIIGYLIATAFHAYIAYREKPGIVEFTMCLLGAMTGIIMADVMGDALAASKAQLEPKEHRGKTLSTVYMCRYLAEVFGFWAGAIICNKAEWHWGFSLADCFTVLASLPLLTALPAIVIMEEEKTISVEPIAVQLRGLWRMVQLKAVYVPLSFIVLYNALGTYNAAWGNYLQVAYNFSAFQYGSMSAVGSSLSFLGIYIYRTYMMQADNWRLVYLFTTFVIVVFAICNIALVFHLNESLGIPPYWFALGDNAVQYFAYGVQYMPSAIVFVAVCPKGQEGLAFALLTGFQNLAGGIASSISNLLLGIWPVQLEDLKHGHFDGVWKLTVLANCIRLIPLFFITCLLPKGMNEIEQMKNSSNRVGGYSVVVVWAFAFVWVIVTSMLAVTMPCLHIVGGNGCK